MEEKSQLKLKDPQTFRIFISSPFNGMEGERETLTKLYWPRLESALATRGLRLRLVDMRWGITHSSSVDSQTINICLREVDRSDFFIGLYAQRYGWHGINDQGLQENFEKAQERFPWILDYREKSVTELEYRHSYLNDPGKQPACFCFRDQQFDETMLTKAKEEGNAKRQKAFTPESPEASKLLETLKEEVRQTEKQTHGVLNNYATPEQAAEFIYNRVSEFVNKEILSATNEPPSKREKSLLAHEVYMKSRAGKYIGGQRYFEELDKYVMDDGSTKPYTIVGKTGSGKSALIANWVNNLTADKYKNPFVLYHLVGAEPDSASTINLLLRLIENLHPELMGEPFDATSVKHEQKELLKKLQELFKRLESEESKYEKKIVIIVDKVDQMSTDKTSKQLYWLPTSLHEQMRVILTVTSGHEGADEILEILEENYKASILEVTPITDEDKRTMCQMLLDEYSKSMDEEQLNLIVSSPKTSQPFFLMVLIQELCVSGKFRELNKQIKSHLEADGVSGLLCRVLKRIEADYYSNEMGGNLAEEVLCAICLCRKGIAESELPMPQHVWAPLIYAMEKYLINKGGLLSFAFPEIGDAVEMLYMNTEEKKKRAAKRVSEIFLVPYLKCLKTEKIDHDKRVVLELPYLLKISGDKERLVQVMSDIKVFEILFQSAKYDLNEYWNYLGVRADVISRRLMKSLDCFTATRYSYHLRNYDHDGIVNLMKWKSNVIDDIRRWMDLTKLYHGLDYIYNREIDIDTRRPGLTDIKRDNLLVQVKYFKACFLSDIERYKEALAMHMEVLEGRKKLIEEKIMDKEDIGMSYHGIGLCYYNIKQYDEGEKWFRMALEAQDESNPENASSNGNTYCNLGLIEMARTKYKEAIECFEKSNALWQKVMPDQVCLDMAYNYHNLALVHRKMKDYDQAEKMYMKSMKMKERLLGKVSYDVAITLMNLGTVETYRKNHEKSLNYNKQSLAIFQELAPEGSYRTLMAEENVVNQLTMLDRYEEAEPMFQNVVKYLQKMEGGTANGLGPLHRRFMKWYESKGHYEKALEVCTGLVTCSKGRASDVAFYMILIGSVPNAKPVQEGTYEYGISKWPDNRDILMAKIALLVDISTEEAVSFMKEYCDKPGPKSSASRYLLMIDVAKEDIEDVDIAIQIATAGVEHEPENSQLREKLEALQKEKNPEKNEAEKTSSDQEKVDGKVNSDTEQVQSSENENNKDVQEVKVVDGN